MEAIIGAIFSALLAKCHQQTSTEDPQKVLRDSFNATTGKMDPDLVRECIPAYRQASRKAFRQGSKEERKAFRRLSTEEIYANVEAKLIADMNATEAEAIAVFAAADAMQGDD